MQQLVKRGFAAILAVMLALVLLPAAAQAAGSVALTFYLDSGANTGLTVRIMNSANNYTLTDMSSGVYTRASVADGTYDIYKNGVKTGSTITVNGATASASYSYYTVSFAAGSGSPAPASQVILSGSKVAVPPAMAKTGSTFDGWYTDSGFSGTAWDFATDTVTGTTTLYAKWNSSAPPYTISTFNPLPTTASKFWGEIAGNLTASARIKDNDTDIGPATINWFSCSSSGSITGNSLCTGDTFSIPTTLSAGTYTYYYCAQATGAGAAAVNSAVLTVDVFLADASDCVISGSVGTAITAQSVLLTLRNDRFSVNSGTTVLPANTDVSSWFSSMPAGIRASVHEAVSNNATTVRIYFEGTPTASFEAPMSITIPGSLLYSSGSDSFNLPVTANPDAKFAITASPTSIGFSNLTANGSDTSSTTTLTLTLDQPIYGALQSDDITVTGATKGTVALNTGTNTYSLSISNITVGDKGKVKVELNKAGYGYVFSPSTREVTVRSISVVAPVISPATGRFTLPCRVSISCATAGATIRYTTDGTDPTESSAPYGTEISINGTTTIKAKAFKSGMPASSCTVATITIGDAATDPPVATVSPTATFYQGAAQDTTVTVSENATGFGAGNLDSVAFGPASSATLPTLSPTNYNVTTGSIVLTLHKSFLDTLTPGTYTLRANLTGATSAPSVETTIVVIAANVPTTGDNDTPLLWAGLILLGGAGLAVARRRRKRAAR